MLLYRILLTYPVVYNIVVDLSACFLCSAQTPGRELKLLHVVFSRCQVGRPVIVHSQSFVKFLKHPREEVVLFKNPKQLVS